MQLRNEEKEEKEQVQSAVLQLTKWHKYDMALNKQQAEICNNAPRYQSFTSTGLIVAIIMIAFAIVLIIGVLRALQK
ncbi:MAG TPA: hypothetical protein VFJ51_00010 [Nitrososphaeraceae archaeon]|nr:hypothetical protein [Nitrososphaeraceae archaeon]